MHIEFLLEEPSAKAALDLLLPKLLPATDTWNCIPHGGKDELLVRLPGRLKTYARVLAAQPELRVVILMDADADCRARKARLESLVAAAGLLTKTSAAPGTDFRVLTRLAVTELEAWFLGDRTAIMAAYERVRPHHFKGKAKADAVDTVPKPNKQLHEVLQAAGYYKQAPRLLKIECAETIAPHLDPTRNESASFRQFCTGLGALR